jgi:hypothetical protein
MIFIVAVTLLLRGVYSFLLRSGVRYVHCFVAFDVSGKREREEGELDELFKTVALENCRVSAPRIDYLM